MGNINQRLNGLNALAYLGVNAVQPPDFITKKGPPTANDSKNFYLGQIWLDTTLPTPGAENVWMLVALNNNEATWVNFAGGGAGTVGQFTADAGANPVLPDGAGNVNMFGAHGLNTDATANTLTFAINNDIELGDLSAIAFGAPALRAVTGNVQIDSGNLTLPATTQEDVGVIQIAGNSFLQAFGTGNAFVGSLSGNFTLTGTNNSGFGSGGTLSALTSGSENFAGGANALTSLTTGSLNVSISGGAALTTGTHNTFVGYLAGDGMVGNTFNTCLGQSAGGGIGATGDHNVMINASGAPADANTIRIADNTANAGLATSCYIGGISGVTPSGATQAVVVNTAGQLGSNASKDAIAWTPVLQFGGSSTGITQANQGSYYTQIGNTVWYCFNVTIDDPGSTATGNAALIGMPWTVSGFGVTSGLSTGVVTYTGGATQATLLMQGGVIGLFVQGSGLAGNVEMTNTNFAMSSSINGSGVYFLGK